MSSYFLGIDPSATSTGLTILGEDASYCNTLRVKPGKLRDIDRLVYIHESILGFIADKDIALCVFETPSYGSTHKEFILGEALGAIKLALGLKSISSVGVAPTQLKKYLTGRGTASKQDMILAATKLGCPVAQEDICDSYAAATLCKDLMLGPLLPTRSSREIRLKLLNNKQFNL